MVTQYFRHPAYQDYPVVGVSWQQAVDYCDWRTDRVNERRVIEAGALGDPKKETKLWRKHLEGYWDEGDAVGYFNTMKYIKYPIAIAANVANPYWFSISITVII